MSSSGSAKVFIVEDNFIYSYLVESMLKDYGDFKITTFGSAEECIALLGNNPDLIILDYKLGSGMNGLEAFKIIHASQPKVPVIILSSQNDVQIAADFLQLGAYDYIEKKDLEEAMEKLRNSILSALGKKE
ncbi:MAG TPA: response regulator [Bacteroidia bacterium]|nr:response regulator [Bacteroidia bacterium]